MMEDLLYYVINFCLITLSAIVVFILARRLSHRISESVEKTRALRFEIHHLMTKLSECQKILEQKDEEISRLKSELDRKELEISELKEQLKFAEKVSKRDLDSLRLQMAKLSALTDEMMHVLTDLYYRIQKEIEERRKRE